MRKETLLQKLEENRKLHIEAFNEATQIWMGDLNNAVAELAKAPCNEGLIRKVQNVWSSKPVSYEESYDNAIMQMAMEIRDEIELDQHEFNQLVCDNWDWSRALLSNAYSAQTTMLSKKKK